MALAGGSFAAVGLGETVFSIVPPDFVESSRESRWRSFMEHRETPSQASSRVIRCARRSQGTRRAGKINVEI